MLRLSKLAVKIYLLTESQVHTFRISFPIGDVPGIEIQSDVDWLIDWMVGWLVDWLAGLGSLVGVFVCWLVCFLDNWLAACLLASLFSFIIYICVCYYVTDPQP